MRLALAPSQVIAGPGSKTAHLVAQESIEAGDCLLVKGMRVYRTTILKETNAVALNRADRGQPIAVDVGVQVVPDDQGGIFGILFGGVVYAVEGSP